jgi:hypothetical protein
MGIGETSNGFKVAYVMKDEQGTGAFAVVGSSEVNKAGQGFETRIPPACSRTAENNISHKLCTSVCIIIAFFS